LVPSWTGNLCRTVVDQYTICRCTTKPLLALYFKSIWCIVLGYQMVRKLQPGFVLHCKCWAAVA
jgi:hypothetical protein